jgi:cytochrome c biogenesis protein CcdA
MLPAYMGLYLGVNNESEKKSVGSQLGKAMVIGGAVTAGFVLLFALAGVIIGLGARSLVGNILPWLGLIIGVALTITGAWMVGGGKLYTALATQIADKMGNPGQANVRGYFLFGLSYGTASLGCTLPIFLAVVGTSFAASSIATSFAQFVLYALGMGVVIITLTLGMALFKGAMVGGMRKIMPYVQPVGIWLMIIAGSYIVFYWLTVGGLLDGFG